jgi:hypothetical protein
MDVDELAGVAVSALALRLGSGVADPLVALISRRLQFSYIGKRALAGLRGDPADAWHRELTTAVIADELTRGPVFERALTEAVRPTTVGNSATKNTPGKGVRYKRFRVGPIRFGGWGLAILAAIAVLLVAAAGIAVYESLVAPAAAAPMRASRTGVQGVPLDLDNPADRIPDLVFGDAGVAATAGAAIGPRPLGTALTGQGCARAADGYGKTSIATVNVGDVICVRTSHGGVAAVTVAKPDRVDWLYWQKI